MREEIKVPDPITIVEWAIKAPEEGTNHQEQRIRIDRTTILNKRELIPQQTTVLMKNRIQDRGQHSQMIQKLLRDLFR